MTIDPPATPLMAALTEELLAQAYPWPDGQPWLRTMMLHTLDGAVAGHDGRSGSISAPADRLVLAQTRRLCDVVLIGAGTLRAERYGPMRAREDAVDERRALGQADAPTLAIVTASVDLPFDDPVFGESTCRPIVLTRPDAPADRLARAREQCDVLTLAGPDLPAEQILAALHERGLRRIVCEGGPRLAAQFGAARLIDEVDLSIGPLVTAGGQVSTGAAIPDPERFDLAHVLHQDGFLFTGYVRRRAVS